MRGKNRTAVASIVAATALVLLKLTTGIATGSLGLVSAGIESSGDVIAAILTFFAIRLAGKPADEEHQYGHARAENVAALGEAAILIGGGIFVVHQANNQLTSGGTHELTAAWYVFAVLAIAIVIDVSRTLTSLRTAREYNSAALRSNAFHFGADLAGTFAVLVGLVLVRAGYQRADAIVALFIAVLIFSAAARLVLENVRSLMDTASTTAREAARRAIADIEPAVELGRLRIREAAGQYFADVVVRVPATAALAEGHAAADAVEHALESALPGADVVVHVEPNDDPASEVEQVLGAALSVPGVREAHNVTVLRVGEQLEVSLHLKVPADTTLAAGNALVRDVQQSITQRLPNVTRVQTHLEPLEPPLEAEPVTADTDTEQTIQRLVHETADVDPHLLRLLRADNRLLLFLAVTLPDDITVAEAHRIASTIEQKIHNQLPQIDEIVLQTEPSTGT
jgi:cation diffusion facilitator family transporter